MMDRLTVTDHEAELIENLFDAIYTLDGASFAENALDLGVKYQGRSLLFPGTRILKNSEGHTVQEAFRYTVDNLSDEEDGLDALSKVENFVEEVDQLLGKDRFFDLPKKYTAILAG